MKIGIIGAGHIGGTLARLFADAGDEVALANSRGPDALTALVERLGPNVRAATAEEAAAFGEVVVEAIPFGRFVDLPKGALAGKVLVSASNYFARRDGDLGLAGRADTELVQERLPDTRVVKAFNTVYWEHLRDQGDTGKPRPERRAVFLAGDDEGAKRVVADLVTSLGFGPVDTGSLHDGGLLQQPGGPLFNRDMTVAEAEARLGG